MKTRQEILKEIVPADCWPSKEFGLDNFCNVPIRYIESAMEAYASQFKSPELETIIDEKDIENELTNSDSLLPCPFCGQAPIIYGKKNKRTGNYVYRISCPGLDCTANTFSCENNIEQARRQAINKWQKRLSLSTPSEQEAIAFAEWVSENYHRVESEELDKWGWVNFREETILVHGSDYHYTTLLREAGKTTEQLYQLFKSAK